MFEQEATFVEPSKAMKDAAVTAHDAAKAGLALMRQTQGVTGLTVAVVGYAHVSPKGTRFQAYQQTVQSEVETLALPAVSLVLVRWINTNRLGFWQRARLAWRLLRGKP